MTTPRLALENKGPFDLPPYHSWILVATGPSLEESKAYVDDPGVGIMAVNSAVTLLDRVDVAILGHYENVFLAAHVFPKIGQIYVPDPCDTGVRDMKISARNLFDFDYWATQYPYKIRIFEKEYNLERSKTREGTLFAGAGIATTGLALLAKNGIKECLVFGVDGGRDCVIDGLSLPYQAMRKWERAILTHYDGAKLEFVNAAKALGINIEMKKQVVTNGL